MGSTPVFRNRQARRDLPFMTIQEQTMNARLLMFGLLLNCPVNKNPDPGCPLSDLRDMTSEEKLHYVEGLSERTVVKVLQYHAHCQESRIETMLGVGRCF